VASGIIDAADTGGEAGTESGREPVSSPPF